MFRSGGLLDGASGGLLDGASGGLLHGASSTVLLLSGTCLAPLSCPYSQSVHPYSSDLVPAGISPDRAIWSHT